MGCVSSSSSTAARAGKSNENAADGAATGAVPLDGIAQSYLIKLVKDNKAEDWTVGEFCDRVVKPMTAKQKCSLTKFLLSSSATSSFASKKADVFISYAWKYKMGELVACLELSDDRFLWIDVAVVNQHTSTSVGQQEWLLTFASALKEIGSAELILMPWQHPIPIDRSWCVFEQYVITSQKIPFIATMLPKDEAKVRLALRNDKFMFKTFLATFGAIDCEKSTAFKDEDRQEILGLLRDRKAIRTTNDATMLSVKKFLLTVALAEAEDQKKPTALSKERANVFLGLGTLLDSLGDFKKAVGWYEQAAEVRREILASLGDNADEQEKKQIQEGLGSCLSGLGAAFSKLDRIKDAETAFNESLVLKEASVGRDHPDTIKVHEWLGTCLYKQEKFNEALPILETVVQDNTRILGENHENTLYSLSNLAACLNSMGRSIEALPVYEKTLTLQRKILGESHPAIGTTMNNLAVCHDKLNQPEKALEFYREAIEIKKKALGDEHVGIATALHNLAVTLDGMGRKDEGADLGRQAVKIFIKNLGKDHANTRMAIEAWGEA